MDVDLDVDVDLVLDLDLDPDLDPARNRRRGFTPWDSPVRTRAPVVAPGASLAPGPAPV